MSVPVDAGSCSAVAIRLLADGIFYGEFDGAMDVLNELLRPIQYEAVQWPDGSCIVLKDSYESHPPDPRAREVADIFTKIVLDADMPLCGDVLDSLVRDRWVESVDGRLGLTKRSLVQYADFISGLDGRYRVCSICGFLSDGDELHESCRSLLEEGRGL